MAAKFKTVTELNSKINGYFRKLAKDTEEIACEHGLANHLGITVRTLRQWYDGKCDVLEDKAGVAEAIEMAYDRLAMETQQLANKAKGRNAVGYVNFLLKQKRFGGYQDKIEQKVDTSVKIKFDNSMEESDFH